MTIRLEHPSVVRVLIQCEGKEAYATPQLAQTVLKRRLSRRKRSDRKLMPYRCNVCGLFHIGGSDR